MLRLPPLFAPLALAAAGASALLGLTPRPAAAAAAGPSGYHLAATWKPGGQGGWDYLTVDPAAHRLYVTRTDAVQVIDTEQGTTIGEVPGLDGGHGTALAPEFNRGFASGGSANPAGGKVVVFDLKTLKPVGEPIPVGKKPDAIIYDQATKHVFVFNGNSEDASVIDAATAKVVATVPLGGAPEFAASDDQGTVFVNLEDKSEVLAIDARANRVTRHWPLAPGETPTGLAIDPAKRHLFAGCHNERMVVVDADGGKVLATTPIGKGVDATAFDPGTGFALCSNGDGTLTVAKEEGPGEFRVVENVATKPSARTMALDPQTHAVYLSGADFEPVPTPAPGEKRVRPKMIPGSFVVLKFVR